MRKRRLTVALIASTVLLAGLLFLFNPNDLPIFVVILPFGLLFVMITTFNLLIFQKLGKNSRNYAVVATLIGVLPVTLLILQSIGQLTPRDVFITLVFLGVASLYIARTNFSS